MNYLTSSFLTNSFKLFKNNILTISSLNLQQARTTFIVKRRIEPPVGKLGSDSRKKLKRKHYIYDYVENKNTKPKEPIELILLESVKGVGFKGDLIKMKVIKAYNKLLLPKLATYATSENVEKIRKTTIETSSPYVQKTIHNLGDLSISVIMNSETSWTMEPRHVRASFIEMGFLIPLKNIKLPPEPISGPNMDLENKLFFVTVTINDFEKVKVCCRLLHHSDDPMDNITFSEEYLKKKEYIFPSDQPNQPSDVDINESNIKNN